MLASGTPAALKGQLGSSLRVELVVDPGAGVPELPALLADPVVRGNRLLAEVALARAGEAVAWAKGMQDRGRLAEFSVGPASLEDVYVRQVVTGDGSAARVG